ncbi:MAG: N-acetylmuramoyl-L-alanine amidase [Bacteroidota bacterium]|nr:N-acetylmuramoyl-L-alanine amidase [Bacteroidota bacterium]
MKKLVLLAFLFLSLLNKAADYVPNNYQKNFETAYSLYPSVPKGILEAVAFSQSRFTNIQPAPEGSCTGLPQAYGVMGLIEDGKNYFRNNLVTISKLSGFTVEEIKGNPEKNILAYAKAYSALQLQMVIGSEPKDQVQVLIALSELPNDEDLARNFALNSYLYQVFWFLNQSSYQEYYNFPDHKLKLEIIFGFENYKVLSSQRVTMSPNNIEGEGSSSFKTNSFNTVQSADYAPAIWDAAASCNYSSRGGTAISAITIHDVEGTYAGCISWFKNCNASVSAHYVLRSSDGQITQMVLETNKAWHVGSENPYTIGLEHEGYVSSPAWYTNAMYTASANLCRDICNSGYGINPLRCYNGPSCNGICTLGGCVRIKGHQHYSGQTHSDPGQYWDWYKFYNLINNAPAITTVTAATGTIYDSGGASGNYTDDERSVILIQPAGATNITLNFSQFNLETNWDYLYIYDGATTSSTLIGRYTGTASPGVITSSGGSLLLDFRSDCATTGIGWTATYTTTIVNPQPGDVTPPSTQVFANGNWQTQSFTATIQDNDNAGGSGVQKGFYQVIDYDGAEWRANDERGFFSDNFDVAIHPDWTQKTGTWTINSQALEQTDEASGNTNIYAKLKQNLSNRYLYHFYAKIDGLGTNRRAGFHFACSQPDSLNRGDGYFAWFRTDDTLLQIYKVVNNVFGSPVASFPMNADAGQWYDYKIVYDRISGKIWVYQNNGLVGTYTDGSPYANGTHISFRSGNADFAVNELKIYRSRAGSVTVNVGPSATNDIRYQNFDPQTPAAKIKSICQDSADNLSAIYYQNLNIDWTAPMSIDSVRDGIANDILVTDSIDRLTANWDNSFDSSSAVLNYWYAIGTTSGDSDVVNWTANMGATTVTKTGLSLVQGQMYYFSVKAENGAGLFSQVYSSNGQLVDTTSSSIGLNDLYDLSGIAVYPNPFTEQVNIYAKNLSVNGKIEIRLTDVLGRLVYSDEVKNYRTEELIKLDLKGKAITPGTYILRINTQGYNYSKVLIKE